MTVKRRQSERGYALIFVFAMSAMMAMMLYMEMPRLALEMQRNREQLLIDRGEQYVRAIKVFTKKNKKYPQTIEELESTNGVRFLRRRYADPMADKDEWRLIHVDGSGRLTDSLVQKAAVPGQNDPTQIGEKSANTFVSEGVSFGSTGDPNAARVAQALNRRASEQPGAAGAPPPPGAQTPGGISTDPLLQQQMLQQQQQQLQQQQMQQSTVPIMGPNGQPIQRVPGLPGQFGQYPAQAANSQTGGAAPANSSRYSSGSTYGNTGTTPPPPPGPQQTSGNGQNPVGPGGFRPGGGSNSFGGQTPGQPGAGGMPGGIAVNPATRLINDIIMRPNPQGLANLQNGGGTQAMGGGIAGVASKHDAEGIKIYKEKTNYKEWEFVYDPAKDQKGAQGQNAGQIPGQIPGQVPGQNPGQGTGFGGQPSGIGGQPGGFGGQPGGFGGAMPTRR
jgi:type II secretory pathway pseudopilin PulG